MDALFSEAVIKQLLTTLETASTMGGIAAVVYFIVPLIMHGATLVTVYYVIKVIVQHVVKVVGDKNDTTALTARLKVEEDAAIALEKRLQEDVALNNLKSLVKSEYLQRELVKVVQKSHPNCKDMRDVEKILRDEYLAS